MLKNFKIDTARHAKVVDVEFYQMSMLKAVEATLKNDPSIDPDLLASWSKFSADPIKAKGFWAHVLQSIFLGQHNADEMNAELQFRNTEKLRSKKVSTKFEQRVAMIFLSIDNKQLADVKTITSTILPGFLIVGVGGVFGVTGKTVEQYVLEQIEIAEKANQHVLILSGGMAQRSFSVAAITELYLAYDNGEAGSTIQKMSRTLTAAEAGKVGRIVSLSFDPNRNDKFDQLLLTTAINYQKTHGILRLEDALKKVIATVDIFQCTDDGRSRFEFDTYLQQLLTNNSLSRIIGKTADISNLSAKMLTALAEGNADYFRTATVEKADKGKTHKPTEPKKCVKPANMSAGAWEKTMMAAREVVVTIAENIDILVHGTGTTSIVDALTLLNADKKLQQVVTRKFGVDYNVILFLFENNIINIDLVEILWHK